MTSIIRPGHSGSVHKPGPAAGFAAALRLGAPQQHGSLAVVPLSFARDRGPRYQMLAEALREGTFHITEVNEGGSVPELRVTNQGAMGVLILDGEELIGAKQNRVLNTTILVKEKSSLVVPVSCVEAGRWHYRERAFRDEEYVVHPNVRRAVHESVSSSLLMAAGHRSDQGRVWGEVGELQGFAEHRSQTSAHRDVYAQRATDIAPYLAAFPLLKGQHGLLVLRDGEIVGLDFVSRVAGYAQVHGKLVRSYAFGAVTREMEHSRVGEARVDGRHRRAKEGAGEGAGLRPDAALARARSFLESIGRLEGRSFKSPGRGWDVRYRGTTGADDGGRAVAGSTVVVSDWAVHGAFFVVDDGGRDDLVIADSEWDQRMAGAERRRRHFRGPTI